MHLVAEVLLYGGIAWVVCVLWWHLVMRCFMGPRLVEFDFLLRGILCLGLKGTSRVDLCFVRASRGVWFASLGALSPTQLSPRHAIMRELVLRNAFQTMLV